MGEEEFQLVYVLVLFVIEEIVLYLLWSRYSCELQVVYDLPISHFSLRLWLF